MAWIKSINLTLFEKFLIFTCLILFATNSLSGYLFKTYFDKYNEEVKAHIEDNAKYKQENESLLNSVEACTESVVKLKKESDERETMAKKEVDKAREEMKNFKKSANYWQDKARKIPPNSCPEGDRLLNEYLSSSKR